MIYILIGKKRATRLAQKNTDEDKNCEVRGIKSQ